MIPHHDDIAVPDDFICPITQDIFTDPVMDSNGRTFQRNAILKWLTENVTCPLTREPRRARNYIPNAMMMTNIRLWMKQNGIDYDDDITFNRQHEMVLTLKRFHDDDTNDDTSEESSSERGEEQSESTRESRISSRSSGRRRRFRIFRSQR
jgi:hypothetical protein